MSLKYEPSSKPLHISAKLLFLNQAEALMLELDSGGDGNIEFAEFVFSSI